MVRDPLYRAIQKRLDERLDPEMFERCAVDLLRAVFPGLAPIRGGDDGGMDGAIADARGGSPLPLVVTTAKDVIGNVTKNLKTYRGNGGSAREAVLATSRPLTPQRRTNLEQRTGELGFALRQIHDGTDFAGRLYRNPEWRRELLGLTGDPPALSVFPRSPRPWPVTELLGRDEEQAWLRAAKGDVVVGGQPGVGKTALLGALAKEGLGLFVASQDIGMIADACREFGPDRVFVDDAHLDEAFPRESLLGKLLRLRQELGTAFRIVATTWPGHEDDIRQALYLTRDQALRVNRLDRSVMADIVRGVNRRFTDVLVGEILDQSKGRPGLAVTLAQWAQRGEFKDLVNGQLLLTEMKNDIRLTDSTLDALAPFALAGGHGMRLQSAAHALEWSENDLRQALRPVSGTGILKETDDPDPHRGFIGVQPEALSVALVERAYFSGALCLPVEPAIEQVTDPVPCTHTLIQVMARGGRVPHGLIRRRLEELHAISWPGGLWERYVATGEEAARWILEAHPDKVGSVARAALALVPDIALDGLLNAWGEDNSGPDDPTRIIESWVQSGLPGRDATDRRIALVERLAAHTGSARAQQEEWPITGQRPLADLFRAVSSLTAEDMRTSPVDPLKLNITSGSLLPDEVRSVARKWPAALAALRTLGDEGLRCARHVVEEWARGQQVLGQHPATNPTAEKEAPRMLQDVVELADRAPGVVMWGRRLARDRKLEADLPALDDPLLDRLFPDAGHPWADSFPTEVILASARELADEWQREGPQTVAGRVMYYERQRELADHIYPNILEEVPTRIAQRVAEPSKWLEAFLDHEAPGRWVQPFLEAAIAASPASDMPWEMLARYAAYDRVCAQVGLSLPRLPESAVGQILKAVRREAAIRRHSIPWGDLSHDWQCRLLRDSDARLRCAAAAGLWRVHRGIRPSGVLGTLLWDAVLESGDPALLQELLGIDRMVARSWILQQARGFSAQRSPKENPPLGEEVDEPLAKSFVRLRDLSPRRSSELLNTAIAKLTIEDRRDLVLAIPSHADERLFAHLVGTDVDLYQALLQRRLSRHTHLAPLRIQPLENREALVQLARKHGYSDCGLEGVAPPSPAAADAPSPVRTRTHTPAASPR